MGVCSDIVRNVLLEVKELLVRVGKLIWLIRSYFWVFWWSLKEPIRQLFKGSATIILLLASLHFLAEVAATFFNERILSIHLPTWIKITIVILAIWMVRHRWKEFMHDDQESIFSENVAKIFGEIAALDFSVDEKTGERRLTDFIAKVLLAFSHIFRKKPNVRMSIMLRGENQRLKTIYWMPENASFDLGLELSPGEGAAGKAYKSGNIIYIPAIKYLQGIAVKRGDEYSFSLESLAYQTIAKQDFKSLVCFPIVSSTGTSGVLNVDSPKENVFGVSDFNIGYVAASVIGMALDKYRNKSNMISGSDREGGSNAGS